LNQIVKRKIQHSAVNNQEDEDSCTRPDCFQNDAQLDKKEEKPDESRPAPDPPATAQENSNLYRGLYQ
jgi:hypothetical protein